ncbi:hypothetical protein ACNFG0_09250 [Pseudomonas sp. NY15372]|uniref:hypothetical protein n=1 Tax=Pseudomonas sp. NY15372 TaxID=3400356 RepID=UPI003A866BEE
MKKSFLGLLEAGEPLIVEAIEARRELHKAEAEARPTGEIERLRMLADALYEAVTDYQMLTHDRQVLH